MKTISILGTASNAGKSWVTTALCAWLKRQGIEVAPFKAQNMANNAYATLEGGEIGVSQAVQAEACGLRPIAEMNPILLKPSGPDASQLVRLGKPGDHLTAGSYYQTTQENWEIVKNTLDWWKSNTQLLIMEGAGSPVELNLMDRDIVNLKPISYTDGKWLLVADIERGGVFAQVVGTWHLLPEDMRSRGLGFVVNQFRGDPRLFDSAHLHFQQHLDLPMLGVLPHFEDIVLDDEDSMNALPEKPSGSLPFIAGVRYPHLSNTPDLLPWKLDCGIKVHWVEDPADLRRAAALVLPGSKHTVSDLHWLRKRGLDRILVEQAQAGVPVVGICGGLQMLGQSLYDQESGEREPGLDLLPIATQFLAEKTITRRRAHFEGEAWETFEIHTGETNILGKQSLEPLLQIEMSGDLRNEGYQRANIWGSYQHGLFDSPKMRRRLVKACGLEGVRVAQTSWKEHRKNTFVCMADLLESHLDLSPILRFLEC